MREIVFLKNNVKYLFPADAYKDLVSPNIPERNKKII